MGGFDGFTISFGDGTDDDTVHSILGHMVKRHYVVAINGEDFELRDFTYGNDLPVAIAYDGPPQLELQSEFGLVVKRHDDDDGGDLFVPFGAITSIKVH